MAKDKFTVILTHEHTDFDALASMLGAYKLHPHAVPVLPRSLNRNLQDFLHSTAAGCLSAARRSCPNSTLTMQS